LISGFVIRRVRPADRAQVWSLHRAATSGAEVFDHDEYFSDLKDLEASYLNLGGEFLVGVTDTRIVAMGGLLPRGGGVAEILRMRVHPAHQRSGFATVVLETLEGRARELGCRKLVLQTTLVQVAARRFYESQGFVETGIGSEDGYEVVGYAKDID